MVYANFSSNLPTGLQHFEFVDLTINVVTHIILTPVAPFTNMV